MKNKVWKTFAAQEVSHSVAHYLTTIFELNGNRGYARVSDIARELELTKGSVSLQMKHLKEKGFVTEDENRFYQLTELGEAIAHEVKETRKTLTEFLIRVLAVPARQAEEDVCKIEHLLSSETTGRVMSLVEFLRSGGGEAHRFFESFQKYQESLASEETLEEAGGEDEGSSS